MSINKVDTYLNKQYNLAQELGFEQYKEETNIDGMQVDFDVYQLIRRSYLLAFNEGNRHAEESLKSVYKLHPDETEKWLREE